MLIPVGGRLLKGPVGLFPVDNYGADPTGQRVSDQAFAEAYGLAAQRLITGPPVGGAIVVAGAGLYQFSPGKVQLLDARIGLLGPGSQACTFFTNGGGGDLVYATNTVSADDVPGAAPVGGFSLYGWNSGSGTNGLHYGDRSGAHVYDIVSYGFNTDPTSRSFLFRNDNGGLCERNFVQVAANQSSILYDFDGNNANGSFDYGNYFLAFNQTQISANPVGFRLINQGHMFGAFLRIQGNASNSNAGRTITCLQVGASGTDTARLNQTQLAVSIECDGSTGPVKDIVVQGASGAAGIVQCGGQVLFLNASGSFTAGSVTLPAVVTGWGTWAGPLFSTHGTLTALGTAAAGLSTYSG